MTPERWKQVEAIYQAALDFDEAARPAFLAEACGADEGLRHEVESLLEAHRSEDRFLESGALNIAARGLAARMPRASAGQRLGAYQLIELLGAGGMGEVWRALDPGLRRHVAIKILPSQYSADPDRLRRFEQEAHAAGRLNHPNVLSVYAIGEHDGFPYLVTELLEGMTLRQKLAGGPLPEVTALEYADQLVQGLAAAHDKGIVHRDLKPENVFVTNDERLKILDFGLAKLAPVAPEPEPQTRTATGMALGTPGYMAPEQVRGDAVDHRTDVFAVGVVLYEMLAGRHPFAGETSAETMTAILKADPPPMIGVSAQVEQIVRHCLEKAPAARYQSARDLAFQLRLLRHPSSSAVVPPEARRRRVLAGALVAAILLAATVGFTWWLTQPAPQQPAPTFRRLTSDSGLTTDPALSPDGRYVAYASDRAGEGNLDIWVQELATGNFIRRTSDSADESEPTFSPDGSRIAFRSERDGGGIWTVPAIGGDPRFVAPNGRRPRFSPNGTLIAYSVTAASWYVGRAFTVPAIGGAPVPVQPEFASVLDPVWSDDGSKLLFVGAREIKELLGPRAEWWIAPAGGGPAVRTGALEIIRRQGIASGRGGQEWLVAPDAWIGNDVFFAGGSTESTNLWRISVSPRTAKVEGSAHKLTSGTSLETKPSVVGNRIAFASESNALNIWSLDLAANSGIATGSPQQVTSSAFDARTSTSADGKKLVFISLRLGNSDVWIKDLESGKESALTATPAREQNAEISPDGKYIVYVIFEQTGGVFYKIPTSGGVPERICEDCGRPWDWSPDGRKILYLIEEGRRTANVALGLLDVATGRKTDYLVNSTYSVARVRFSPDGHWISFTANNAGGTRLVVAPFRPGDPPGEDEWIWITERQPFPQDKSRWSPDGALLYYVSNADGFRCIWAQRLDPGTKHPVGQPLAIHHSHGTRRSIRNVGIPLFFELSLTPDKIFFNMSETTGNIWMAEWPTPP